MTLKPRKGLFETRGKSLALNIWPEKLAEASLELAVSLIKPNLTFNKRETALLKETAGRSVKPFFFKVKKGEIFIREGERVTPEQLLKLSAQYKSLKQKKMLGRVPAMVVLMAFLLISMYHMGLEKKPGDWFRNQRFGAERRDAAGHILCGDRV